MTEVNKEEENNSEEEENEEEETEFDPEKFTEEDYVKLTTASKSAAAEAKRHREAKQALETELAELRKANEDETDTKLREAREEAEQATAAKYTALIVKAEAKAQLAAMGLQGSPDRFVKLLDHSGLEVDEDGTVSGLDAQLRALKADYPEVFKKQAPGKGDVGDKEVVKTEPKTTGDKFAQMLNG